MRRSKDYLLRTIAGETILIPTGAAARQLSGLVTLNELGAFIWQQLADDCTLDTIAARITAEYDVDDATAAPTRRIFCSLCMKSGRWSIFSEERL